ncbi:hypothetical protein [Streptomyces sp. NPDC058304]|uniref:hypothetical protein n=1 Tax=Streptomyces sp. NPDC058304 TaxID=3346437 RepID=UPI0036E54CAB
MYRTTLSLGERIADAAALLAGSRTVRCPYPGCSMRIRYRAVTPQEANRLTGLATDHARH